MELELLDDTFSMIHVIDTFNSLLWIDRYWEAGSVELSTPPSPVLLSKLQTGKYLRFAESEHVMVIEDHNIHTDVETGDELLIKGRSLESLLERRIVWGQAILNLNFQSGIADLLNDNIVAPFIPNRTVDNFEYIASTDPVIVNMMADTQFIGTDLYTAITGLCRLKEVGFKITLTPNFFFRFELYAGVDRSYNQAVNPYVVFSTSFDNLKLADYIKTDRFFKTIALVAGEQGVGGVQIMTTVFAPGGSGGVGFSRREMYLEPNVQRNLPGGGQLSDEDYIVLLQGRGAEELAKNVVIEAFDGEADPTMYTYGEDFYMGDVLQVSDNYGHSANSRVTEMVYSQDREGIRRYPTFTSTPAI